MLVHVNEQNLYNSAVSKNCQVNSLSSETKTEDNSASAHRVSLSGADCDGSDGDKLGGLLVNKVHVMHT